MLEVKILLLIFLQVLLVLNAIAQEKRLALVIGNSNYTYGGTLANPENDADAISNKLIDLGFNVLAHKDLDQKSMMQIIDDFGMILKHYDVGLFFYAGHGIQAKGTNYLIPVDANIRSENDVEYNCVKADRLLARMEDAGSNVNIIILDACRDNPFERQWTRSTTGRGLAFMNSPVGTLIAYSTAPGTTASDGYAENSPYTTALINYIDQPNTTILQMFQHVRKEVREKTDNLQIPWESTSLEGNFYFVTEKTDLIESPVVELTTTETDLIEPPAVDMAKTETELIGTIDISGYFIDRRDAKKYKTVEIGKQVWMAENLNFEHNEYESFCYNNVDINCKTYGRLYPWHTAVNVCPAGWHLPSDDEWKELEFYLGMSEEQANELSVSYSRGKPAGKQLQEDDSVGFNLLYAGFAKPKYIGKYSYKGIDYYASFWTSTINNNSKDFAWCREILKGREGILRCELYVKRNLSVRCIRDNSPE